MKYFAPVVKGFSQVSGSTGCEQFATTVSFDHVEELQTLNFYTLKTLYEGKFMWDVWGVNQMVFYTAFFYIGVDGLEGMLYLL